MRKTLLSTIALVALMLAPASQAAPQLAAVRPLPGFDHVNSWIQAMPRAVTWFRSLP